MVNIAGHHFVLEMDVSSFITVHSVEFMGIVQLDVFLCIVDHPIVAPWYAMMGFNVTQIMLKLVLPLVC